MFIFKKLCRLCTSNKDVSLSLTDLDLNDNLIFANKLNEIAPGILESNKELPNGICTTCISQLNEAYKFIKICYSSQQIYKQQLQSKPIVKETNDSATFEFIKVEPVEDDELVDESIEFKIDENELKVRNSTLNEVYPESSNANKHLPNLKTQIQAFLCDNPYKCHGCEKSFRYKSLLLVHSRSHSNAKPYKCHLCNGVFTAMSSLKKHIIRIHTNQRPFKCRLCEKAFSGRSDLTRHARVHTKEKPYRCRLCNQAFTQGGNMRSHMLNKHKLTKL